MGQLFDRVSRVVRSELNSSQGDCAENYLNGGSALMAGGSVIGASIGKVGILAGGTGYSLGVVPLGAAGALTGVALYEALRSLLESDASSGSAAAIGAAAGVATSSAIGGVGVAVGGSAIGVGMASMAVGGAVVGLGLVGLNRLFQQGLDPEKLLDSAIDQMEIDGRNARQAMIQVIACQKRLQQQYDKTQAEVNTWHQRTQLALQKGDEHLAREALVRKKMHSGVLSSLQTQLNPDPASVKKLKKYLPLLEAKISEAKAMRTRLKEQIEVAKLNGQLQRVHERGTSSAMAAFERMEEKVLQMETRPQVTEELSAVNLDNHFAMLSDNFDEELEAMKAQMLGTSQPSQSHRPSSELLNALSGRTAFDAELEDLKRMLDQL
jgi:phage shock protein A